MPTLSERILEEADRCVKCGYCLPACPTYLKERNEAASPRGRIALIQGMLEGALSDTFTLEGHLQRCLTCRACEPVCPSGVHYGLIIDGARTLHEQHSSALRRHLRRGLLGLLTQPAPLRFGARFLTFYRRSGLQRVIGGRLPPTLKRAERLLPPRLHTPRWQSHYPAPTPRGRVALFTGCIGNLTDQAALRAAITVLNAMGYSVEIPSTQACCGAMHRHGGYPEQADHLGKVNDAAFDDSGLEAVVGIATACCAELQTYTTLGRRVVEISTFLDRIDWPTQLKLRPLAQTVAVHEPCSQRLLTDHDPHTLYRLLRRVPEIDLQPLADNAVCCGAAGTYMLTQPVMADALLEDKLTALRRTSPQILLTSNTGCALHLAAGIRTAGLSVEVMHPVELIARQLPTHP